MVLPVLPTIVISLFVLLRIGTRRILFFVVVVFFVVTVFYVVAVFYFMARI
jgi:hypothetical protein|tara:strand:- start:141 stop:293 length:153 start_codon:yes stop_codon:yes gene_type:complete